MTASPNGSNIMSQLSGSPNNHAADYFQPRDENNGMGATTMASAASTAFYDQVRLRILKMIQKVSHYDVLYFVLFYFFTVLPAHRQLRSVRGQQDCTRGGPLQVALDRARAGGQISRLLPQPHVTRYGQRQHRQPGGQLGGTLQRVCQCRHPELSREQR